MPPQGYPDPTSPSPIDTATDTHHTHAHAHNNVEILALEEEPLGAEVVGMDVMNHAITDDLVTTVRAALLRHKVLVFRDQQNLSVEKHIEFSRRFGELQSHVLGELQLPGYEEVIVVSNEVRDGRKVGLDGLDEGMAITGRRHHWHSDLQYLECPAMGSLLHAKVLPASRDGDTLFADCQAAYESLDGEMRALLANKRAQHRFLNVASQKFWGSLGPQIKQRLMKIPPVVHPVVRTHPETGGKSLFVSEAFTCGIEGMDESESRKLLAELQGHITRPQFVYRHKWKPGDLVFWDNRCLLHLATGSKEPRTLYRTTVAGDAPV